MNEPNQTPEPNTGRKVPASAIINQMAIVQRAIALQLEEPGLTREGASNLAASLKRSAEQAFDLAARFTLAEGQQHQERAAQAQEHAQRQAQLRVDDAEAQAQAELGLLPEE